jgi:hypothetical protein
MVPPRPFGGLDTAPVDRLIDLAQACWGGKRETVRARAKRCGRRWPTCPGSTVTPGSSARDASPVGRGEVGCHDLETSGEVGSSVSTGFRALFCFRAVRPSLLALRRCALHAYAPFFIAAQRDPLLERFAAHVDAQDVGLHYRRQAPLDIASLLTVQGVGLADVTAAALLHFVHETRRVRAVLVPGAKRVNHLVGQLAGAR